MITCFGYNSTPKQVNHTISLPEQCLHLQLKCSVLGLQLLILLLNRQDVFTVRYYESLARTIQRWGGLQQSRPSGKFNREQNLRFQGQYFDKDKFVGNKFEQRLRWPVGRVSG